MMTINDSVERGSSGGGERLRSGKQKDGRTNSLYINNFVHGGQWAWVFVGKINTSHNILKQSFDGFLQLTKFDAARF
jgi:hypothetical protein